MKEFFFFPNKQQSLGTEGKSSTKSNNHSSKWKRETWKKKFALYPIRSLVPFPRELRAHRGSRAEVERKPLFLSRYCHYRAAKGLVFSFFLSLLRLMNRGLTNRVNRFCTKRGGIIIILFGTKIGADRFNKRIKIYSIFPLVYVDSTLFLVLAIFSSISSVIDLDLLRSRIGKITWITPIFIN